MTTTTKRKKSEPSFQERMKMPPTEIDMHKVEALAYERGEKSGYQEGLKVRIDTMLNVLNKVRTPFISRAHLLDLAKQAVQETA